MIQERKEEPKPYGEREPKRKAEEKVSRGATSSEKKKPTEGTGAGEKEAEGGRGVKERAEVQGENWTSRGKKKKKFC